MLKRIALAPNPEQPIEDVTVRAELIAHQNGCEVVFVSGETVVRVAPKSVALGSIVDARA